MGGFDPQVTSDAWNDPAALMQIGGMLLPNVYRYGPNGRPNITLKPGEVLGGLGSAYGALRDRRLQDDAMTKLTKQMSQQPASEITKNIPGSDLNEFGGPGWSGDSGSWSQDSPEGGSPQWLPSAPSTYQPVQKPPPTLTEKYNQLQQERPPSEAEFMANLSPEQRRVFARGTSSPGGGLQQGMGSMFDKLSKGPQGPEQQFARREQGLQADVLGQVSADPGNAEASALYNRMALGNPHLLQVSQESDRRRDLVALQQWAVAQGIDPKLIHTPVGLKIAESRAQQLENSRQGERAVAELERQGLTDQANLLRGAVAAGLPISAEMLRDAQIAGAMVEMNKKYNFASNIMAEKMLDPDTVARAKQEYPRLAGEIDKLMFEAAKLYQNKQSLTQQASQFKTTTEMHRESMDWQQTSAVAVQLETARRAFDTMGSPITWMSKSWIRPDVLAKGKTSGFTPEDLIPEARAEYMRVTQQLEEAERMHSNLLKTYTVKHKPELYAVMGPAEVTQLLNRYATEPGLDPASRQAKLDLAFQKAMQDPMLQAPGVAPYAQEMRAKYTESYNKAKQLIQTSTTPPGAAPGSVSPPTSEATPEQFQTRLDPGLVNKPEARKLRAAQLDEQSKRLQARSATRTAQAQEIADEAQRLNAQSGPAPQDKVARQQYFEGLYAQARKNVLGRTAQVTPPGMMAAP